MVSKKARNDAARLAKELGYPKIYIDQIKNAQSDFEIQLALRSAREMMSDKDHK